MFLTNTICVLDGNQPVASSVVYKCQVCYFNKMNNIGSIYIRLTRYNIGYPSISINVSDFDLLLNLFAFFITAVVNMCK